MDFNIAFLLTALVNLIILLAGGAAAFFAVRNAKNNVSNEQNKQLLEMKNEIIATLEMKTSQLEDQVLDLKRENVRLSALIDDLVTVQKARERLDARSNARGAKQP